MCFKENEIILQKFHLTTIHNSCFGQSNLSFGFHLSVHYLIQIRGALSKLAQLVKSLRLVQKNLSLISTYSSLALYSHVCTYTRMPTYIQTA